VGNVFGFIISIENVL